MTLPGGVVVTSIESDEEGEWYAFEGGSIFSEGANGMAATPGYFNYTQCMILNWDGVGTESSWSWTANGSMIGTKADDASGEFREMVQDPLNSGRGECVQLIPDRLLNAGGAVAKQTRVAECWTAGNGNDMDDWTRMYTYIPAETPLTEVAFQFDIYVPQAWVGTGQIEVVLFNNYNFGGIGCDDTDVVHDGIEIKRKKFCQDCGRSHPYNIDVLGCDNFIHSPLQHVPVQVVVGVLNGLHICLQHHGHQILSADTVVSLLNALNRGELIAYQLL